mmetsp:Transcript_25795/g.82750  ORF Transcript_25795/g.82750 Transcript_25795/m.82750 type:complete len:259 (-) Transcript_25795:284-1060(-)
MDGAEGLGHEDVEGALVLEVPVVRRRDELCVPPLRQREGARRRVEEEDAGVEGDPEEILRVVPAEPDALGVEAPRVTALVRVCLAREAVARDGDVRRGGARAQEGLRVGEPDRVDVAAEDGAAAPEEGEEGGDLHRAHPPEARLVGADAAEVGRVSEDGEIEYRNTEPCPARERGRVERCYGELVRPSDGRAGEVEVLRKVKVGGVAKGEPHDGPLWKDSVERLGGDDAAHRRRNGCGRCTHSLRALLESNPGGLLRG